MLVWVQVLLLRAAEFSVDLVQLQSLDGRRVLVDGPEALAGGTELVGAVLIPTAVCQLAKVSLDQMLRRRLLPATGGRIVKKIICWIIYKNVLLRLVEGITFNGKLLKHMYMYNSTISQW